MAREDIVQKMVVILLFFSSLLSLVLSSLSSGGGIYFLVGEGVKPAGVGEPDEGGLDVTAGVGAGEVVLVELLFVAF